MSYYEMTKRPKRRKQIGETLFCWRLARVLAKNAKIESALSKNRGHRDDSLFVFFEQYLQIIINGSRWVPEPQQEPAWQVKKESCVCVQCIQVCVDRGSREDEDEEEEEEAPVCSKSE